MITIPGISDHDAPEQAITMAGIRTENAGPAGQRIKSMQEIADNILKRVGDILIFAQAEAGKTDRCRYSLHWRRGKFLGVTGLPYN
ncbi:MAG: hypothetical protein ACREYF_26035 [Gammaproteobacteria bacterium]